jgi:hypothetical protein
LMARSFANFRCRAGQQHDISSQTCTLGGRNGGASIKKRGQVAAAGTSDVGPRLECCTRDDRGRGRLRTRLSGARRSDGLINKSSPGAPGRLSKDHKAFLPRLVEEGPIPAIHGVVRWRAVLERRRQCKPRLVQQPERAGRHLCLNIGFHCSPTKLIRNWSMCGVGRR